MREWIRTLLDVRRGEGRLVGLAAGVLFLLVAGHTILETARDALFLASLPAQRLALVYVALAGLGLLVAHYNRRFVERVGRRNALVATLLFAAFGALHLSLRPVTPRLAFAVYLFSGLFGTVLVAQFWLLAGQLFTVAQGRRLFGLVSAGGVLGAASGALAAAVVLRMVPVQALLLVGATCFVGAAVTLTGITLYEESPPSSSSGASLGGLVRAMGVTRHPYVLRLVGLTALSAAAGITTDYLFKTTAARSVPPAELGPLFARTYAWLNGASLAVQVLLVAPIVRRAGVVGAAVAMPVLLTIASVFAFVSGGSFGAVLVPRAVDGALRHSLHRVTAELLWMPVSPEIRGTAKPAVDTVLGRLVQALLAAVFLVLAARGLVAPPVLAALLAALALGWAVVAADLWRPYLGLFRDALRRGELDATPYPTVLDVRSIEALLEALSSTDPRIALGAVDALTSRGAKKLLPGLVLAHEAPEVLVRALRSFAQDTRPDVLPRATRLLTHADENVRMAAARVLAHHGAVSELRPLLEDASAGVRVVAAYHLAVADGEERPLAEPRVRAVLHKRGEVGRAARVALAEAVADTRHPHAASILLELAEEPDALPAVAAAMARVKDPRFVPVLIERLAHRDGREAVMEALLAFGDEGFEALVRTLHDADARLAVRLATPRALARFEEQRAVDVLTGVLASPTFSGALRYRALLGLESLAQSRPLRMHRAAIDLALHATMTEHLRLLALVLPLQRDAEAHEGTAGGELVRGLVEDKLGQSLERAFRLLQLMHRSEDLRGVYLALHAGDRAVRAQAVEFVEALRTGSLAARRSEARRLLRIVTEDLPAEDKLDRAGAAAPVRPRSYVEVLALLQRDRDVTLASLAAYHAAELGLQELVPLPAPAMLILPPVPSAPASTRFDGNPPSVPRGVGR